MTSRMTQKLRARRRALLVSAGVLALAGAIARGQSKAALTFEVISVKPVKTNYPIAKGNPDFHGPAFLPGGRFTVTAPLIMVIAAAYDVPLSSPTARISGGPDWINSANLVYDIEATTPNDMAFDGLSARAQATVGRQMLQALLADRFKLVIRPQTKKMPVYVLMVEKNGPKFPIADIQEKDCPVAPQNAPGDGNTVCHRFNGGRGRGLHARAVNMSDLANFVQGWTDRPLFDETGLQGLYRIETEPWLPMELDSSRTNVDGVDVGNLPTIFTVFERLGLKMAAQERDMETYVIDHVEKPTEN